MCRYVFMLAWHAGRWWQCHMAISLALSPYAFPNQLKSRESSIRMYTVAMDCEGRMLPVGHRKQALCCRLVDLRFAALLMPE